VKIENVMNYGLPRTLLCGPIDPNHPTRRQLEEQRRLSGETPGFLVGSGCETRGIGITASTDVTLTDVDVRGIRSRSCNSYGIHVFNGAQNALVDEDTMEGIKRVIGGPGAESFTYKIEENSSGTGGNAGYR
jgi:hypothetical protein